MKWRPHHHHHHHHHHVDSALDTSSSLLATGASSFSREAGVAPGTDLDLDLAAPRASVLAHQHLALKLGAGPSPSLNSTSKHFFGVEEQEEDAPELSSPQPPCIMDDEDGGFSGAGLSAPRGSSMLTVGQRLGLTWLLHGDNSAESNNPNGQLQENERVPQPPPRLERKPKGWLSSFWNAYNKAYNTFRNSRSGWGNAAAGIAGFIVGPHNC